MAATTAAPVRRQRSGGQRLSRWLSRNAIRIYAVLGFTYLFIPVAYTLGTDFKPGKRKPLDTMVHWDHW